MIGRTNAASSMRNNSAINSYINVVYPAGSACSCSNGTITLNSQNTIGMVSFGIPVAGNWTVSCTDGVKSKSVTYTVSAGDIINAKLSYTLWLIRDGKLIDTDLLVEPLDTAYLDQTYDHYAYFSQGNMGGEDRLIKYLDLTGYSNMAITISAISSSKSGAGTNCPGIGVSAQYPSFVDGVVTPASCYTKMASSLSISSGTYTLDISAINGENYIWFYISHSIDLTRHTPFACIEDFYIE